MRVGGNASWLVKVKDGKELVNVLKYADENGIPNFILGNGTNTIFIEDYQGILISSRKIDQLGEDDQGNLKVGSGVQLPIISQKFASLNWTGMEFGSTIPGTLGGALIMNAGAYGQAISDSLLSVEIIDWDFNQRVLLKEDITWNYRHSSLKSKARFILGATMKGKYGNRNSIIDTMNRLKAERLQKQPIEFPSAGSIFKNPPNQFAGKLIEDSGLRGFSIGDAQISDKHANFIINRGKAKATDVLQLIEIAHQKVYDKYKINLNLEVLLINGSVPYELSDGGNAK